MVKDRKFLISNWDLSRIRSQSRMRKGENLRNLEKEVLSTAEDCHSPTSNLAKHNQLLKVIMSPPLKVDAWVK